MPHHVIGGDTPIQLRWPASVAIASRSWSTHIVNRAFPACLAAAFLMPFSAARAASEDEQLWLQANASVRLGDGLSLQNELNARFADARHGLYEIENNLLLGYRLGGGVTAAAGYTHDPQYEGGHFRVLERRAREQLTFDNVGKIGGGSITLRLRAEQRWRDGLSGTGWRMRPFVRYALPLSHDGKVQLLAGHESFINLNRTGFQSQAGWERMRNNVAVRFPLRGPLSADVGYVNQYTVVRGGTDRLDHAATVSVSLAL